jgi:hypothetical protein
MDAKGEELTRPGVVGSTGLRRRKIEKLRQRGKVQQGRRPAPNDRRYLSAFTNSKIWSVSSVSGVLIE